MTSTRTRVAALTAAAAITVTTLTGCGPDSNTKTTTSSSAPSGTSSTPPPSSPGTSMPATSSTTSSAQTAETQAYQDAEAVYRKFIINYQTAVTHFDSSKLNKSLATPGLLANVTQELNQLRSTTAKYGVSALFTQEIQGVLGTKYREGKLAQLQVCAVTNFRFIRNGKDVTTDEEKNPQLVNTVAKANQMELVSVDNGKSWKVNRFVTDAELGAQC